MEKMKKESGQEYLARQKRIQQEIIDLMRRAFDLPKPKPSNNNKQN